ncbi:MAG: inositol monophosphatase family protein [Thermoleophilia bacterium]
MSSSASDIQQLAIELTGAIRARILPQIGSAAARAHAGTAAGGDVTFGIDEVAEEFLVQFLRERGANVAMYSEDKGLLTFGEPEHVLIIDPVDGTRPAAAGLEGAMVSVAVADLRDEPTMGDVSFGCLQEIKSGALFTAVRGEGVSITGADGEPSAVILSENTDLARLFWTIGFRGRPARALIEALGDLVDASSVDGAVFDLGSATFSITRILTGQLDAYVDVGPRMIEEVPEVRPLFERVGKGAILNNSPHDLAAVGLIAREAGAFFGDGWGNSLSERLLLGSEHEFQMSCIAASNGELAGRIVAAVDEGIDKLRAAFGKSR